MKKLLVFLCIALAASVWAQTPVKYALVIGNGNYTNFGTLKQETARRTQVVDKRRELAEGKGIIKTMTELEALAII